MSHERRRPGPSTRAIRASSRVPDVRQAPTAVPIYQTATFASQDAEELAAVLDGQPGYAYSRIDNPTTTALGAEGGREAGRAFVDALQIPERTGSLGSVHTMVVHPPTSSHRALDAVALAAAGIAEGLLRVSVGLEDEADLLEDFTNALAVARSAAGPGGTMASSAESAAVEVAPSAGA